MGQFPSSPVINYPTPVDNQHQGPKVKVTAALCLCFAAVVIATRLLIRWPWRRLFGFDDGAATAASLFALSQWLIIFGAVSHGLGTASELLSEESIRRAEKLMFAGDLFYVLTLFWSKLSVCLFFRRLSASTVKTLFPNLLTCACAVLGVVSVFTIALREQLDTPWVQDSTLGHSTLKRWIAVEIFAILVDVAIVSFPFKLVWSLQMQRDMKFWVLVGFGIRIPLIPIAIMRLKSLSISLTSEEYLLDAARTEYFTQAEMTFSLIAATIPCLRIFMEAAKTGLLGISMWEAGTTTDSYSRSYASKKPGTYSRNRDTMTKARLGTESIQLRDRAEGSNSARAHATSDKVSVASDNSEAAIIVRQTVDVRYERE